MLVPVSNDALTNFFEGSPVKISSDAFLFDSLRRLIVDSLTCLFSGTYGNESTPPLFLRFFMDSVRTGLPVGPPNFSEWFCLEFIAPHAGAFRRPLFFLVQLSPHRTLRTQEDISLD